MKNISKLWKNSTPLHMILMLTGLYYFYQMSAQHLFSWESKVKNKSPLSTSPCTRIFNRSTIHDSDCDTNIGFSEMKQWLRYRRYHHHPQRQTTALHAIRCIQLHTRLYTYKVSERETMGHFILQIEEEFNKTVTRGGSSFRASYVGDGVIMCSCTDLFNGRYRVCCPKLFTRATIVIKLMYTNFTAFADTKDLKPLEFIIYNKTAVSNHRPKFKWKNITRPLWVKIGTQLVWSKDSIYFKAQTKTKIVLCLDSMKKLYLIGDSNLRFTYDYIIESLGFGKLNASISRYHRDHAVGNIHFIWARYAEDVANKITNILNINQSHAHVSDRKITIVFNSCTHDLAFRNSSYFLRTSLPVLTRSLSTFHRKNIKDVRIIWMNAIAYPHRPIKYRGTRNNFVIKAVNYWMSRSLRSLDVDIFDVFSVTYPRVTDTVCNNHYLCRRKISGKYVIFGDVGIAAAHELLDQICKR